MSEKKPSILIVDDEPNIVDSLCDTFIDKYNMYKAYSAKEALEIIKNNEIDLIISDHRMPETTGIELFGKMEKDHPHIGRVLLTGYDEIQTVVDAINKGDVDKCIAKPWVEEDITHIVLEVLNTRLKKTIEERNLAVQEQKKSFSLLRAALDSVHDGILVVDLNGNIVDYNEQFQKMWQIPHSIVETKDDKKTIDFVLSQLKYPESFLKKTRDIYKQPKAASEDIIEFKDGRIFERYSKPQKIEDQVVGRVWSFHDMTERVQIEKELKTSKDKLNEALELNKCSSVVNPNAQFVTDSKGNFVFANPASEKIFGYKIEELMGKNISILSPSWMEDEYSKYIESYLAFKKNRRQELRTIIRSPKESTLVKKNGEEISVLLFVREAKVGERDVFVGIVEEITERKKREMILKKTEEYVRSLIDCSMDTIISMDQDQRIVEFNKAAERTFGYKKEEVVGKYLEMLCASPEEAKAIPILLQGRDHFSSELLNKRKDGEIFPSLASVSIIKDADGKSIGTMHVSRDVTHQKNLEEDLQKAMKKAVDASKAKDEFLANMSHEIRTPLNGIIGMSELLMGTDIKDDQMETVRTLYTEATSLLDIVNDVLDFSKIEAGKLDLEEIPFDIRITIGDITNSFTHVAAQKGLEFNCFLAPDIPFLLIGDPVRLRQILANLVGNALKFTHKGEIFIKGEMAEELENDRVKIRFLVTDTGIGIPKEKQKNIFESFGQADGSTTRQYGGTGLGTTISKQLTERMGGEIGVESDEGKGSTFFFTVVFSKQKEQEHSQIKETNDMKDTIDTGKKISEEHKVENFQLLLVEDYPTNQQVVMKHLHKEGYQVDLAENGLEAVEAYKRKIYDIIFMDIQMPLMDGYEATAKIRDYEAELKSIGSHLETHAVIIAMTAHAQKTDREKCLEAGMDDYISKPLRRKDFLNLVDKWVKKIAGSRLSAGTEEAGTSESGASSSNNNVPIDLNRAIDEFEGDRGFLMEVLEGFLKNVSKQINTIRKAISDGDAETVGKEAHSIKGGAANLTADNLSKVANELEKIGKSGAITKGNVVLERLVKEHQSLEDYVKDK